MNYIHIAHNKHWIIYRDEMDNFILEDNKENTIEMDMDKLESLRDIVRIPLSRDEIEDEQELIMTVLGDDYEK